MARGGDVVAQEKGEGELRAVGQRDLRFHRARGRGGGNVEGGRSNGFVGGYHAVAVEVDAEGGDLRGDVFREYGRKGLATVGREGGFGRKVGGKPERQVENGACGIGNRAEIFCKEFGSHGEGIAFRLGGILLRIVFGPCFLKGKPFRGGGHCLACNEGIEELLPACIMEVFEQAGPLAVGVVVQAAPVGSGFRAPNGNLRAGVPFHPVAIGSRAPLPCFGGHAACHLRPASEAEVAVGGEQAVLVEDKVEEKVFEAHEAFGVLGVVSAAYLLEQEVGNVGEALARHVHEVVAQVVCPGGIASKFGGSGDEGGSSATHDIIIYSARTPRGYGIDGERGAGANHGFGSALLRGGAVVNRLR